MVLPYINMILPQVYMCSPSLWVVPVHQPQASSIKPGLATRFIYDIIHVSMPFSQIIPPFPSPSPTESKRLFYISVSLLLSRIQGHHHHLSKFHIYALLEPELKLTFRVTSGLLGHKHTFTNKYFQT